MISALSLLQQLNGNNVNQHISFCMKNNRNRIFLALYLLFILMSGIVSAQETVIRVFVSEKIELINGKRFYLHLVEKGQTLYSISVAYNRPIEAISKENSIENNNITAGQILRIPVDVAPTPVNTEKTTPPGSTVYHDVKKGETLFGIAKKYNTTVQELERLNPVLKDGLKAGQRILISEGTTSSTTVVQDEDDTAINEPVEEATDEYFIHIVQKKETLFSISNLYVVPVKDIIALNPGSENGIKPKQNLKIPTKTQFDLEEKKPEGKEVLVTVTPEPEPSPIKNIPCPVLPQKRAIEVVLMLPFYLSELNDINTEFSSHSYQTQRHTNYKSFEYIQFYQGFMMAIDSLKKTGFSANLHVLDITDDMQSARNAISKSEVKKADIIVGPFHSESFKVVAAFAKDKGILMLNPFITDTKSLPSASNLFNLALSADMQLEMYARHMCSKHRDKNVIVVHNNSANETNIVSMFKSHWNTILGADSNAFRYSEVVYNQSGLTGIINNSKKGQKNYILCFSNSEAFVSNFIRKISEIQEDSNLVLYGLPSWQKYNNLELAYLDKLQFHYFSTTFVDYNDSLVSSFISEFRDVYAIEPEMNAFIGYDAGMYFLYAIYHYGKDFTSCINQIPVALLNTPYHFRFNRATNAYDNTGLNFLRYDNYVLVPE